MAAQAPREPVWYDEIWAVGMLSVLVPPLGLLAMAGSRQIGVRAKLALSVAVILVIVVLGAVEWTSGPIDNALREMTAQALRQSAAGHASDGDRVGEEVQLERARFVAPLDPPTYLGLARCRRDAKDLAAARRFGATARELARDDLPWRQRSFAEATFLVADILVDQGRAVQAEKVLVQGGTHLRPGTLDGSRGRLLRARIRAARGDLTAARHEVRTILDAFRTAWFGQAYDVLAEIDAATPRDALADRCEALRYREGDADLERAILAGAAPAGESTVALRAYITALRYRRTPDGARPAARVLQHIVDRYPTFVLADGCLYTAAWCLQIHLQDLHEAARLYERVARDWPRGESAPKALWQAGVCYETLGLPRHRRRCLQRLVATARAGSYFHGLALRELADVRRRGETAARTDDSEE